MNQFAIVSDTLDSHKCKTCHGTGTCDDNDGFGIACYEWTCKDCKGSGFRDGEILGLTFIYRIEE